MLKKKQEIILSQEVATLNEFKNMIKKNIFPLCIYLSDEETEEFENKNKLVNDDLINELYPCIHLNNYIYLDSFALRKK